MLLDLFYHLSNEDPKVRGTAIYKLTSTLEQLSSSSVGICGHEDLDYCLKRLLKGLQSSNGFARQGFGAALTQLLGILHSRSHQIKLMDIVNLLNFKRSNGFEYRDLLMGKVYGYAAICESTIFDKEGSIIYTEEDLKVLITNFLGMYNEKTYLKPLVCQIVECFSSKNPSIISHFTETAESVNDPILSVFISKSFTLENIPIYIRSSSKFAPVLHPVYMLMLSNSKSNLKDVWNEIYKGLNSDNRNRFLLLKLFNMVIDLDEKYQIILLDDKIYALMSKVMSSQSKSLKSICSIICENLKTKSTAIPQIALLLCNFTNLRSYATLTGLDDSQMQEFVKSDKKCLLLKYLIKSKKLDVFESMYTLANLNNQEILILLKAIVDLNEIHKIKFLRFMMRQFEFKHFELINTLLEKKHLAPAASLMAYCLIEKFEILEIDEQIESDLLKVCQFESLGENTPYDVLIDIYLTFLNANSVVIRSVLQLGIKDLTKEISLKGIEMICQVLSNEHTADVEDDEDSLSDAMSISSDAESDAEMSDSSSVDYSSNGEDMEDMVKEAVDMVSDVSSVTSEQMFKIDKHFENMFKLKRQEKEDHLNSIYFLGRVLEIFEGIVHAQMLDLKSFMAFYDFRKKLTKQGILSEKADKIASYMLNKIQGHVFEVINVDLEDVKAVLKTINLSGNLKVYDTILIHMTWCNVDCKAIIKEKCHKYLLNHSLKDLKGLDILFKELIFEVNDSNLTQILSSNTIDAETSIKLFDKLFILEGKMSSLRSKLKPILNCWRGLKKANQIESIQSEIIRIVNDRVELVKKEKQQVGAIKGILYSIVEATGIQKSELPILTKSK